MICHDKKLKLWSNWRCQIRAFFHESSQITNDDCVFLQLYKFCLFGTWSRKKSCQLRFKPRLTKTSFLQRFFFATKTWNMLSGSFLHSSQSNFMAILTHASQMCVHEFRTSVLLFLMQLQKSWIFCYSLDKSFFLLRNEKCLSSLLSPKRETDFPYANAINASSSIL